MELTVGTGDTVWGGGHLAGSQLCKGLLLNLKPPRIERKHQRQLATESRVYKWLAISNLIL